MTDMNKRALITTNFILLQLFLLLFLSYNYMFAIFQVSTEIVCSIVVIVVLFSIWNVKEINRLHVIEKNAELLNERLLHDYNLIMTLRAKHHDFINHLQVIMGLAQMGKVAEEIRYIKDLSSDLIEIEKLIALKRPEIAALISSKISGLSYLQVSLDISTTLENLQFPADKIVSVLGNLIDNAIYEISTQDIKWLEIKIHEEADWYVFEIKNPGNIPEPVREKIFDCGFTTKGEQGSGMGLYIVKSILANYRGQIDCEVIADQAVIFRVKMRK